MLNDIAKIEWRIFSSRFPKGVPHIFEYAVGPGVFSASLASRFSPERILVPCSDQGYWRKYDSGTPLPPASGYPCVGSHHLRRFNLSLVHNYYWCNDLQQLGIELDLNLSSPIRVHIRNIPDIYLYMCSPLGTLRPDTPPLRAASDPVRSYLSIVQYVRSRAVGPYLCREALFC